MEPKSARPFLSYSERKILRLWKGSRTKPARYYLKTRSVRLAMESRIPPSFFPRSEKVREEDPSLTGQVSTAPEIALPIEKEGEVEPGAEPSGEESSLALDEKQRSFILERSRKNRGKRILKDSVGIFFTWLSSGITLLAIIAIFVFVFKEGWTSLSWEKFSGDYFAETYTFRTPENYEVPAGENYAYDPQSNEFYSSRWGVAFRSDVAANGDESVVVSYVAPESPMATRLVDNSLVDSIAVSDGWIVTDVSLRRSLAENVRTILGPKVPYDQNAYQSRADFYAQSFQANGVVNSGSISTGGRGFRGSFTATLYTILLTLLFALPLGIGGAIYLSIYAKKGKVANFISSTIDLLSGIPSIIFGLIGALIFIPIASGGGRIGNLLSGALTLAIMVLPLVVKNTQEAIKVIPKSLPEASFALGASQTQTVFKVVLPNATSGILTGTILAVGRIIGESASLIFAVGTSIQDDVEVLKPATTMAVHIWTVLQGETPDYGAACAIAIVILFIVLILNLILSVVSHYANKFDATPSGTFLARMLRKISKKAKTPKEVTQHA